MQHDQPTPTTGRRRQQRPGRARVSRLASLSGALALAVFGVAACGGDDDDADPQTLDAPDPADDAADADAGPDDADADELTDEADQGEDEPDDEPDDVPAATPTEPAPVATEVEAAAREAAPATDALAAAATDTPTAAAATDAPAAAAATDAPAAAAATDAPAAAPGTDAPGEVDDASTEPAPEADAAATDPAAAEAEGTAPAVAEGTAPAVAEGTEAAAEPEPETLIAESTCELTPEETEVPDDADEPAAPGDTGAAPVTEPPATEPAPPADTTADTGDTTVEPPTDTAGDTDADVFPILCGDEGPLVTAIQWTLQFRGYVEIVSIVDGRYGAQTETGIRVFQEDNDLPVTGVVDAATWEALAPPPGQGLGEDRNDNGYLDPDEVVIGGGDDD